MASMPTPGFTFTAYTLPVIVVATPPLAALQLAVIVLGGTWQWWQSIPAVMWVVLSTAAAHVGHGPGKRREDAMWAGWGGAPTTAALRWAPARNLVAHAELHATVSAAIGPRLRLPSRDEEFADPQGADNLYIAATARMIALTNSADKFPQLKEHLQWYCYRRTLRGLRTAGLVAAYSTTLAGVAWAAAGIHIIAGLNQVVGGVAVAAIGLCAVIGLHRVTDDFVRAAADRYARELWKAAYLLAT